MRELSDREKYLIKRRAHANCKLMMFGENNLNIGYDNPEILQNQILALEALRILVIKNNFNNLRDFYFFKYSTDFIISMLKNISEKESCNDNNLSCR